MPTYTEVVLFLTSLTLLLLLLLNNAFRQEVVVFLFDSVKGVIVLLFLLVGFLLSFYHAFSSKKMVQLEKDALLFFIIVINVLIGISAGIYVLEESQGSLIIFPVFNIATAALLWMSYKYNIVTTKSISSVQAKREEIILGSIMVFIIFFLSQYVFENFWAITFSICVFYATSINNVINKMFLSKE